MHCYFTKKVTYRRPFRLYLTLCRSCIPRQTGLRYHRLSRLFSKSKLTASKAPPVSLSTKPEKRPSDQIQQAPVANHKRCRLPMPSQSKEDHEPLLSSHQLSFDQYHCYGIQKQSEIPRRLFLAEKERQIFDLLNRVTRHLKESILDAPPPTLRVAGGWVRDKLLGKECYDLDIAVDNMTGYQLATHVNDFLKSEGMSTKSIARIQLNPERSKHLETATTTIFGIPLDFVNLRSEKYNADSRIPIMASGKLYSWL